MAASVHGLDVSRVRRVSAIHLPPAVTTTLRLFIFAAVVYGSVFIFPATAPKPGGDSTIFLVNAERVVDGAVMYRDFFEITFPGTTAYYAGAFALFGERAWVPAATLVVLGAVIAMLVSSIAGRILPGRGVYLAGLSFLVFCFNPLSDATHHWFSCCFILAAVRVLLSARRLRHVYAGAFLGAAAFFTQSKALLVLCAVCIWLAWEGRKRGRTVLEICSDLARLLVSFGIAVVALVGPFVWKAGPGPFFRSTVTFVLKYYSAWWVNSWRAYFAFLPPHHSLLDLAALGGFVFVYALVPLAYLLVLARYARLRRTASAEIWPAIMLVTAVGTGMFLAVIGSASLLRLATSAAPAAILVVYLLHAPGRLERIARPLLWSATLALAVLSVTARQVRWRADADLPVGRVAFSSAVDREAVDWLRLHTVPGEFAFGNPPLTFLLGLKNPAPILFVTTGEYTRPEQVSDTMSSLEDKRAPWLFLGAGVFLPATASEPTHLRPLAAYISSHYKLMKILPNGLEVWHREPLT